MGNPKILNLGETAPAIAPPQHRVLWRVYKLRERGVKLSADIVLRRSKVGSLNVWRATPSHRIGVHLIDPSGYPTLENLSNVELLPQPHGKFGLKLAGTELVTIAAGDYRDVPQVWWCTIHSVAP